MITDKEGRNFRSDHREVSRYEPDGIDRADEEARTVFKATRLTSSTSLGCERFVSDLYPSKRVSGERAKLPENPRSD
jgi:hypothetical protein